MLRKTFLEVSFGYSINCKLSKFLLKQPKASACLAVRKVVTISATITPDLEAIVTKVAILFLRSEFFL